jgi:hypothetical protein
MPHNISMSHGVINFMSRRRSANRLTVIFVHLADGVPICAAVEGDAKLYMNGGEVDSRLNPGRQSRRPPAVAAIPADNITVSPANATAPAHSPSHFDSAPDPKLDFDSNGTTYLVLMRMLLNGSRRRRILTQINRQMKTTICRKLIRMARQRCEK